MKFFDPTGHLPDCCRLASFQALIEGQKKKGQGEGSRRDKEGQGRLKERRQGEDKDGSSTLDDHE